MFVMNLRNKIKLILKEEIKMSTYLKRRLNMLDYEVEYRLSAIYRPNVTCYYKSSELLLEVIMEEAIESMYYNYFSNLDDNSGEWGEIYYDMVKYVRDKYGDEIKEYYNKNCGEKF